MSKKSKILKLGAKASTFYDQSTGIKLSVGQAVEIDVKLIEASRRLREAINSGHVTEGTSEDLAAYKKKAKELEETDVSESILAGRKADKVKPAKKVEKAEDDSEDEDEDDSEEYTKEELMALEDEEVVSLLKDLQGNMTNKQKKVFKAKESTKEELVNLYLAL